MTLEQLKKEYDLADFEGRKWLKVVQNEKNNTLNAIATIKMNSFTQIKRYLQEKINDAS